MVDAAREHRVVVRLKGGDPMLFGRAAEEMAALEAAGIDYEIVPGVTAALAGAASLKRSLTLRGVSRSVAFATHSRAPGSAELGEMARADSLVFYMGRDSAPDIARQLLEAGHAAATPVALVEAASTERERSLTLTLGALSEGAAQEWLDPAQPSLVMIGAAFAARVASPHLDLAVDPAQLLAAEAALSAA